MNNKQIAQVILVLIYMFIALALWSINWKLGLLGNVYQILALIQTKVEK